MDFENTMVSEITHTGKNQEQYDLTHVWDIKLKATNEKTRQRNKQKFRPRQQYGGYQRERR